MSTIKLAHIYSYTVCFTDNTGKKDQFGFLEQGYLEEQSTYKLIKLAEKSFNCAIKKKIKEAGYSTATEYLIEKYRNKKPKDFTIEDIKVEYKGQAKWWLTWFAHHSLCQFDTEQEAFSDFESFLEEKGVYPRCSSYPGDFYFKESKEGAYCAMGAEDRRRWELCRCKHCIKNKQTIITH